MKKIYQFPHLPHSTLKLGYWGVELDENSQAELDANIDVVEALIKHFGGEEVKTKVVTKELPPLKEKKTKKDGDK